MVATPARLVKPAEAAKLAADALFLDKVVPLESLKIERRELDTSTDEYGGFLAAAAAVGVEHVPSNVPECGLCCIKITWVSPSSGKEHDAMFYAPACYPDGRPVVSVTETVEEAPSEERFRGRRATLFEHNVRRSGYAEKKGAVRHSWQRRWFVLQLDGIISVRDDTVASPVADPRCSTTGNLRTLCPWVNSPSPTSASAQTRHATASR